MLSDWNSVSYLFLLFTTQAEGTLALLGGHAAYVVCVGVVYVLVVRLPDTLLAGRGSSSPCLLVSPHSRFYFVSSELCQLALQVLLPQLIALLLQSASFIGGKNVKMKDLKCQHAMVFPVTLD